MLTRKLFIAFFNVTGLLSMSLWERLSENRPLWWKVILYQESLSHSSMSKLFEEHKINFKASTDALVKSSMVNVFC